MKALATLMGIIAPVTAYAASGASDESNGFFVWIFVGLCALIAVAQTIPAVLLMFGMAKGIKSVVKEEIEEIKK